MQLFPGLILEILQLSPGLHSTELHIFPGLPYLVWGLSPIFIGHSRNMQQLASHIEADAVARPIQRAWLNHDREFLYEEIFQHPAEAYLARFAEPAFIPSDGIPELTSEISEDFYDCLSDDIALVQGENAKITELKCIVAGLKQEAETYLGGGMTVDGYVARLIENQKAEMEYRKRILQSEESDEVKAERLRIRRMRGLR